MTNEMAVVPAGGWRYAQPHKDGHIKMEAGTKDELAEQIRSFRVTNDLPLGSPEQEIDAYLQANMPVVTASGITLRTRVTSWKAHIQFEKIKFVEREEAERRAQICSTCPMNKMDWGDECTECVAHTRADLALIRQNNNTHTQVGACEVLGQDNMTSVWMDEENLKRRGAFLNELPDFCWVKKL